MEKEIEEIRLLAETCDDVVEFKDGRLRISAAKEKGLAHVSSDVYLLAPILFLYYLQPSSSYSNLDR